LKKINVKPVETLGIEFEDGTIKKCRYTAYAMMLLEEEFEGFKKAFDEAKEKPFAAGAKLLYVGMKVCDENITFDKAKQMACKMSIENILDLFVFVNETINIDEKKYKTPQDHKKSKKKK
jgi:hypothetical protein